MSRRAAVIFGRVGRAEDRPAARQAVGLAAERTFLLAATDANWKKVLGSLFLVLCSWRFVILKYNIFNLASQSPTSFPVVLLACKLDLPQVARLNPVACSEARRAGTTPAGGVSHRSTGHRDQKARRADTRAERDGKEKVFWAGRFRGEQLVLSPRSEPVATDVTKGQRSFFLIIGGAFSLPNFRSHG